MRFFIVSPHLFFLKVMQAEFRGVKVDPTWYVSTLHTNPAMVSRHLPKSSVVVMNTPVPAGVWFDGHVFIIHTPGDLAQGLQLLHQLSTSQAVDTVAVLPFGPPNRLMAQNIMQILQSHRKPNLLKKP